MTIHSQDPSFGPLFDNILDSQRIHKQLERIRDLMLESSWMTVDEVIAVLKQKYGGEYGAPSVQANLRHLRQPQFGAYNVCIKRRTETGLHVYLVHKNTCVCFYCDSERERQAKRRAA